MVIIKKYINHQYFEYLILLSIYCIIYNDTKEKYLSLYLSKYSTYLIEVYIK